MVKPKILIVEDEIIIAWDLRMRVEALGNEVLPIADTADKAVELAKTKAPDLIIMDIALKGKKTGVDAAREIRGFSEVPIVYLTGNTHLMEDPLIRATGAQGMFAKPPSEPTLREMLENAGKFNPSGPGAPALP